VSRDLFSLIDAPIPAAGRSTLNGTTLATNTPRIIFLLCFLYGVEHHGIGRRRSSRGAKIQPEESLDPVLRDEFSC